MTKKDAENRVIAIRDAYIADVATALATAIASIRTDLIATLTTAIPEEEPVLLGAMRVAGSLGGAAFQGEVLINPAAQALASQSRRQN